MSLGGLDLGALVQSMAQDAEDAGQAAREAAEWRAAVLVALADQTAALTAVGALVADLTAAVTAAVGNLPRMFGGAKVPNRGGT